MDVSMNAALHPLTIVAGVLAVASLLITVLFVHDRRQRTPGILLSIGLICLLVAPMFGGSTLTMAVTVIATLLVVLSALLNIRVLRARSR